MISGRPWSHYLCTFDTSDGSWLAFNGEAAQRDSQSHPCYLTLKKGPVGPSGLSGQARRETALQPGCPFMLTHSPGNPGPCLCSHQQTASIHSLWQPPQHAVACPLTSGLSVFRESQARSQTAILGPGLPQSRKVLGSNSAMPPICCR